MSGDIVVGVGHRRDQDRDPRVRPRTARPRRGHVAPTAVGSPDRAADAIASLVASALVEAPRPRERRAALGVGVPGRVDRERGHVTLAVNLDWHDLPLGPRLAARLGIPTVVENDVRAAALGLHRRRLFGPVESLALLAIGTGISAGVVIDGVLHRGANGLAGEIGHVIVEPDGLRCACGNRGCFETVAAGPAICRRTLAGWAARGNGKEHDTPASRAPGAEAVFAAAAAGDRSRARSSSPTGRAIAWGIHLLALAYDVERIVIGGGVSHAGDAFMAPIRRELDRYRAASPLAAEILPARPGPAPAARRRCRGLGRGDGGPRVAGAAESEWLEGSGRV